MMTGVPDRLMSAALLSDVGHRGIPLSAATSVRLRRYLMAADMVAGAVQKVLDAIVDGVFTEDEPLPGEADLARFLNVSRPTMREAVRNLSMGGVLNVVHGRGTFLLPRFRWHELRYLLYVAAHEGRATEVEVDVLEVEAMMEVGAVRLAAANRTEEDLEELHRCIVEYELALKTEDVQAIIGLDHAFHDALFVAGRNTFVASALHPFRDALLGAKFRAMERPVARRLVLEQHKAILEAVAEGDEERAIALMHTHMSQDRTDVMLARPREGSERSENL